MCKNDKLVRVSLEISATKQDGFTEQVIRSVSEDAAILKFTVHGFAEF